MPRLTEMAFRTRRSTPKHMPFPAISRNTLSGVCFRQASTFPTAWGQPWRASMSLVPKKRCRRGLQYPCASLQRLAVKHGHMSFMKEALEPPQLTIQSAKGMPFCPSLKDCKFDRAVLDKVSIFVGTRGTLWQSSRLGPPNTCFKDIVQGNGAGQSKACTWTSRRMPTM